MLDHLAKHRENVISELDKIIDHAKASMKEGAYVHVEHHYRDKDEREGIDPFRYTGGPAEKICIGATIKIRWSTE